MTIKHYELGPGLLIFGTGPLHAEAQVRSCRLIPSESVATTEEKPVLSGERLPGKSRSTVTWTIQATVIQDITSSSLGDWAHDNWHPTETQPFVFVPASAERRARWGQVAPFPIEFGGDLDDPSPETSFTWRLEGWPMKGDYDPLTGNLTKDV